MQSDKTYRLKDLIAGLDVTLKGDPECMISGVAMIQHSKSGHITFLANSLYKKHLASTEASAVITDEKHADDCPGNKIITTNPYLTYAKIAHFFINDSAPTPGIHASAMMGEHVKIDATAHVGANCVIGDHVQIGAGTVIKAGSIVGDYAQLGRQVLLDPRVTLYQGVQIGDRCHISSGVVIGSDGFGFANNKGVWHKVPQLGTVIIGNDVSIGANTTIDRGAIGDTIIEDGVKLDNLIQIGHNVHIGQHTIIAGCVGIAGSATIGKYCMIGGASGIAGHISICDHVMVTGMTSVTKSIAEPGMYSSGILGAVPSVEFRKQNARYNRLENLMQRVKTLETTIKKITEAT